MNRDLKKLNVLAFIILIFPSFTQGVCPQAPGIKEVSGSPFLVGAGVNPFSVSFNNTGRLLVTANFDSVSMFNVQFDGTLTKIGDTPTKIQGAIGAVFNSAGTLVATVSNANDEVTVFSVAADGNLTLVGFFSILPGTNSEHLSFSPDGSLLATSNRGSSNVTTFTVAADGMLTQVGTFSVAPGGSNGGLAFSPDGKCLATGNGGNPNNVTVFSVAADGTLTQIPGSPFTGGTGLTDVAYTPDGKFLGGVSGGGTGSMYRVESDGSLTFLSNFTPGGGGGSSVAIEFSPDSKLLAVGNGGSNNVVLYCVGGSGDLTLLGTFPTIGFAGTLEFSPGGTLLAAPIRNPVFGVRVYAVLQGQALLTSLNKILIQKYGQGKVCGNI